MSTSGNERVFRFSNHFGRRLSSRDFDDDVYVHIFEEPDDRFYDTFEGTMAAVKSMLHEGTVRDILLAYRIEDDGGIFLITIHPLKPNQKQRRINRGRWVRV